MPYKHNKNLTPAARTLRKNMTKEEPRYLSNGKMLFSSIENTMKSIHNSTGSKIAERIFNLYINLQDSNK